MMEIERPKIETASLSPDGRYGKFVAEPLERGFGITLGNSLRRVLLSSLPGVAVTSVKIDGVVHEFSTIEGVKEDVTEIVLNLKGIAAKLYTEGPKTVRVEAVGPCEVTADNIKQGDDIEILNPEWHIATLGEGAKLVMELTFDKGRGYVPAERNKQATRWVSATNTPKAPTASRCPLAKGHWSSWKRWRTDPFPAIPEHSGCKLLIVWYQTERWGSGCR